MYVAVGAPTMDSVITAKLASGHLPRADWERTYIAAGGIVGPCAGCDTPTTRHDAVVLGYYAGRRVVLHPDCYVLWDEERERASE